MKNLMDWIQETIGLSPEVQIKIFASLVIVLVLWILYSLIIKIVWRRTENIRTRYTCDTGGQVSTFDISCLVI